MTSQNRHSGQALCSEPRVIAVVVTYNRAELLPLTLRGITEAEKLPDSIVVVNNASTDSTVDFLQEFERQSNIPLDIIHLSQNLGGAGGFTVGIDRALCQHQADLVWVMDDDTEPLPATLSEAVKAWQNYRGPHGEKPAFVASKVIWDDGEDHPMNTMRTKFGASASETARARAVGGRPIRSASFVSVMMDATVMRREGLPLADFFIWNDDFEYTTRLAHHRYAIACEKSVVMHHTKTAGNTNSNPGPRFYNDVRNKLWVFCYRRTLSPLEKILYGGSTLRLWLSTLLHTDDQKTYAGYFLSGIKDAWGGFRSNEEVLKGVYELEFPQRATSNKEQSTSPQFSLLMSTYAQDNPHYLNQAFESNVQNQTQKPEQFVLVIDGPLTPALEEVVNRWDRKLSQSTQTRFSLVQLKENSGLATALNAGLAVCTNEWVARADADDISLSHRFETQLQEISKTNADVIGSYLYEVDKSGNTIQATRKTDLTSAEIKKSLARRNPMFHPTVMFKRQAVLAVGGYEEVPGAEDYWLWSRLAQSGYKLENIAEPLVKYRTGAGTYEKRGGIHALKQDVKVQQMLFHGYAISRAQFIQNLTVRTIYRLIPVQLRKKIYRLRFAPGTSVSSLQESSSKEN